MSEYSTEVLDAIEVSSNKRIERRMSVQRIFSIILFSVFVIVDLLALVAGTQSYGSLVEMQAKNDSLIMVAGPIVSNVRASDAAGGVAEGKGPEGRSLVLVERDAYGTYETRIYLYHGHVVQEYALGGSPYTPEKATVLAESQTFSFNYEDGLLSIASDSGVSKVALRNQQGGA